MIKEAIATGSTVEEAKDAAYRELGVESYDVQFEVLELPVRKTLGLFGGNPAKVRAYVRTSPADAAAEYLHGILNAMGLSQVRLSVQENEEEAMISLTGEDVGFIIGHRGETLDALQYLSGLVANHIENSYYRITLDIGNYREKRRETLEILGKKMAAKAVRIGRNASLEPMNPYERRIIHTAVQTVEGAKSWSEGEDLRRHVVIGPVDGERPQHRPYGSRPPYRTPYNNNRDGRDNRGREPREPHDTRTFDRPARPVQNGGARQPSGAPRPEVSKGPRYGRIDVKKENE